MSFEYFISNRILKNETKGKKVSTAIVRISVISIALAIVVNLITIAVVKGFQSQVSDKVTGFGSHLTILNTASTSIHESEPILKNQAFLEDLSKIKGVKSISPVAYKPVLFQSERNERKITFANNKDTTITEQTIYGGLLKGVDHTYDWSFFKSNLKEGSIPNYSSKLPSNEILISRKMARDMHFKLGDTIRAYFVKTTPVLKKMIIKGIFETGLEEHDKKIALADLRIVQELNDWGLQASMDLDDTLYHVPGYENQLIVRVNARGGVGQLRYDWGRGIEIYGAKTFNADKDTTFKVVVSDYKTSLFNEQSVSIPDTAQMTIKIRGQKSGSNNFETDEDGKLIKKYMDSEGSYYSLKTADKTVEVQLKNGTGSQANYIGGFEIKVEDWDRLDELKSIVKRKVEFYPAENGDVCKVVSIRDAENDIFVWLSFLDLNVLIIIVLMILIGIVNMGSALLVLILVRTNFIGIMKSMGASDWSIRKIFLYQAGLLIVRGMVVGNIIGAGLALLQKYFNIIPLNAEVYYLNTVPIELSFGSWILLNVGTLVVCVAALIIPSIVITRISPAKSVKFN